MDGEQSYRQMVWQSLKKSVDGAIKCVGIFGIALGAVTTYEHFFCSARSVIPMSIAGLTIWQCGAIILFFGFLGSFIALTIDYFRKKDGKGLAYKESKKVTTGQTSEVFNGIQAMDTEKMRLLFDGTSKLNPEQILALFWGKKGEQKDGERSKEAK